MRLDLEIDGFRLQYLSVLLTSIYTQSNFNGAVLYAYRPRMVSYEQRIGSMLIRTDDCTIRGGAGTSGGDDHYQGDLKDHRFSPA